MNTYIHFQIIEGNIAQHQANQPRSPGEPAETLGANDKPPIPYLSMPNQSKAMWKIQGWDSACLILSTWRWGVWSKLAARTPRVATSSTTGSRRWPGPYGNRSFNPVEVQEGGVRGVALDTEMAALRWRSWIHHRHAWSSFYQPACKSRFLSFKITGKIGKQKQPPVRLCPDAWQQLRSDVRWTLCWAEQWFLGAWGCAIYSPLLVHFILLK